MKILLIGPAGSGKGTIGEMVSDHIGFPQVSLGQILREVPENHPWYERVNEQMEKGELVDQSKMAVLIKEELSKEDYKNGFVLDGWFRSMEDVRHFDPDFDKVIFLNIPRGESIKRLTSRRTCEGCGDVYNIYSNPPKVEGVCDECGGKLTQREDDIPEAIEERLDIFKEETIEVLDYLREKGILIEINAMGTPEEVFDRVTKALGI